MDCLVFMGNRYGKYVKDVDARESKSGKISDLTTFYDAVKKIRKTMYLNTHEVW